MEADGMRRGTLRSVDLARAVGISTQQVRNYEEAGVLPPATRTPSGYRAFTERHRVALLTFRALAGGYGVVRARHVMVAVHAGEVPEALALVDAGHAELHEQRLSLRAAGEALAEVVRQNLGGQVPPPRAVSSARAVSSSHASLRVGELAHQLGVRPSTLRVWESAGLLRPHRDAATGYRLFGPAEAREARLVALLRQSRYPLPQIRPVLDGLREAGSTEQLRAALDRRARDLTARTTAMLEGAGLLHAYLRDHGARTEPSGTGPHEERET
ncbi:MerR family DNA-binding transcriptional regulator [Streptomyces tubbatahanensis]|uniref:MerR family DNA-binding transcriptional regulator n=1 Tax=Streptomyces tubbatahanensis TaxID=2923272 RepID=A0ABY3Y032_9ACTN|nr:MerR family transcriptional regulator [Streptomyces tubbatahanensis]UNS99939.1 MerR family DNA-binding transcriptional regulator [Streptomyces tubbatahanensis]